MGLFSTAVRSLALVALATGCTTEATRDSSDGNPNLGIAEFTITESPTATTVVGLGDDGREVARLELVHGTFTLTGIFKDDYSTAQVDGRSLTMSVQDERMEYQTAGYEPVRELPAPPESQWAIATFVVDPHVKSVLDRWQIGFEGVGEGLTAETPFLGNTVKGDSPLTCNGAASCGSTSNGTINTCGGGATSLQARLITQHSGTNCGLYSSSYDQKLLSQCCPYGSGGVLATWYAQKACPTTTNNSTSCGTRTSGACKACPTYPVAVNSCTISQSATVGTCSGNVVYPIVSQWTRCQQNCVGAGSCGGPDGCNGTCESYQDPGGPLMPCI